MVRFHTPFWALLVLLTLATDPAKGCTGITLKTTTGTSIVARTIEWGGSNLNSRYVIVPRGYIQSSYLPDGKKEGMTFSARYGYVGLAVEQDEFVAEGINEAGLSAGLFYFPGYGKYPAYDPALKSRSIADLQLVSWILGECETVDDVKKAVNRVRVVSINPQASTVHWRFTDTSGRQIVLEIIDGKAQFHDNTLGVLTNSPDFTWQMTNLNNYVNLAPGTSRPRQLGSVSLASFGAGSGMLGLPGDITPPSRFVRAAFYQCSAPPQQDAEQTVRQCFQILNNFDIPIGIEFSEGETPTDIPSATQWTSATNPQDKTIYYRTMYNSLIRCIDLKKIDFGKIKYQATPLDKVDRQPIERIQIK